MKNIIFLLYAMPCLVNAQQKITSKSCVERFGDTCVIKTGQRFLLPPTRKINIPKSQNILKSNLSSLIFNNYNISYERHIHNKFSAMISYRYMPKSSVPFEKQVKDIIANTDIDASRLQVGGYAITPELRFYAHKNMVGFYIAPYVRITSLDVTIPVKYVVGGTTKDADFTGKINSFSGGILLGTQHQIFKKLVLDIWIIGGHFGNSSGDLSATLSPGLTAKEQTDFQKVLNKIDASPFTVKGTVTSATSAYLNTDGPWLGLRGAGFTLGFRF